MKPITFERIQHCYERNYGKLLLRLYKLSIPSKVKRIRKKESIKVLFVVNELPTWKTESLYQAMHAHPRFEPILGVTLSLDMPELRQPLINYCNQKGYKWADMDMMAYNPIKDVIKPDIIFYEKPYMECYHHRHTLQQHLNSLFCYIFYSSHTIGKSEFIDSNPTIQYCWQHYFESQFAVDACRKDMVTDGKNIIITGFPMYDSLMLPLSEYKDPWKQDNRKRIVYAPHHSIGDSFSSGLGYGTFLENYEFILQLARRYADKVQWIFKPHPGLHRKLVSIWGKEKTDAYYNEWATMECSQICEADYQSLFRHSNAMIHDCSSFQVEYLYTKNPVMYLIKDENQDENRNAFGLRAFNLHYKASKHEQIEQFVQNVLNGIDPMQAEREQFYNECLLPPNGKTACENIINAILGN